MYHDSSCFISSSLRSDSMYDIRHIFVLSSGYLNASIHIRLPSLMHDSLYLQNIIQKVNSLIKPSNPVTSIPLRFISVSICKQMDTRLWIHALADTSACHSFTALWPLSSFSGQALDLLVLLSSMHYCTSTRSLSTSSSSRGLTSFEWDILSWGGLHA